jgi:hypothetical protein
MILVVFLVLQSQNGHEPDFSSLAEALFTGSAIAQSARADNNSE